MAKCQIRQFHCIYDDILISSTSFLRSRQKHRITEQVRGGTAEAAAKGKRNVRNNFQIIGRATQGASLLFLAYVVLLTATFTEGPSNTSQESLLCINSRNLKCLLLNECLQQIMIHSFMMVKKIRCIFMYQHHYILLNKNVT